jgi:hypothetical protein
VETVRATLILLTLTVTALTGCASMSQNECTTADWRTIGYEDGAAGYGSERMAQHRKACADHGVRLDLDAYQAGRTLGLNEYCQPQNAYRVGSYGSSYKGVCPAELEPAFVAAYEAGRTLYTRELRVNNARNQIASKEREVESLEDQMAQKALLVIGNDTTAEQRAQALLDTRQLAERRSRIAGELEQLRKDKIRYERELEDYRGTLAYVP